MKNYSITREKAAIELGVSTRTVDRYVKSGKLSYKKIANKVLLAKDEIEALKSEFSTLHNEVTSELIHEVPSVQSAQPVAVRADIDQAIDEKIDRNRKTLYGNFAGDFYKGKIESIDLPDNLKEGLILHRIIDGVSDRNENFLNDLLHEKFHHFKISWLYILSN